MCKLNYFEYGRFKTGDFKEMRDSMIVYRSFFEAVKELPEKNQAQVWNAVFEYSLNFKEIELTGISKTIFTLIKPQLEANLKKYKNGTKPKGSKTEAKQKQDVSKEEANGNENGNVNENVNGNENAVIAPELNFNYMIGDQEILSVEETFKEKFLPLLTDLKLKYGELKIKKWIADFSILHKQKSWKDYQDFRHHISNYIKISSEKDNGTVKKHTTENSNFGSGF